MMNVVFALQGGLWGLLLVYPSLRSLYRLNHHRVSSELTANG